MKRAFAGIWIDRAWARIIRIENGVPVAFATVHSFVEPHQRRASQAGDLSSPDIDKSSACRDRICGENGLHCFFDRVSEAIPNCSAVIVMGPCETKRGLASRLQKNPNCPNIRLETTPKLSDRAIVERIHRCDSDSDAGKNTNGVALSNAVLARGSASRTEAPRCSKTASITVIAASAGGLRSIMQILDNLPKNFPSPLALVLHRTNRACDPLPDLIRLRSRLPVKIAESGEALRSGRVYMAPPNQHLSINMDRTITVSEGRKIRHLRSSVNPLFESASEAFGDRVIAVVLSGSDSDAMDGVKSVKNRGGTVILQDLGPCDVPGIPASALRNSAIDHVLRVGEIVPKIVSLVEQVAFLQPV